MSPKAKCDGLNFLADLELSILWPKSFNEQDVSLEWTTESALLLQWQTSMDYTANFHQYCDGVAVFSARGIHTCVLPITNAKSRCNTGNIYLFRTPLAPV